MMKTIKELADELGVSKTAIRKHMDDDFRATHTENLPGNVIGIDEDGCKLIAESLRKPQKTTGNQFSETTGNQSSQEEVAFLREQLRVKDRQIEVQQEQISQLTAALEHTTASLHAAQALHAGTMQVQLDAGEPQTEVTIGVDSRDPEQAQAAPEPKPNRWQLFLAFLRG